MSTTDTNPLDAVSSPDINAERLAALKRLFPDLFSNEGRLNVDELKKMVDPALVTESERYDFRWYGKTTSKREAFTPSRAALIYDPTRSVNPDKAGGNVIIEGENLEVLKLLNRAYRERIKCIYIDPPYNTGKDFVYSDNYSDERKRYWELTGVTVEGVKSDTLSEADGRRHSRWLSMMHSRLLASRYLLRPDGIILLSIDDNEYHNLKRLLDEVFGAENFIATMVWEKGRKNDARFISVGHEYLIVYGKDFQVLKDKKVVWREEKPGAQEIWAKYIQLRVQFGSKTQEIGQNIQKWFSSLPKNHPSKKWDRYKHVDENGPWRDDNISWPGGGGPRYDVIHPLTKKPCKVPERGWIFASPEEMQRRIKLGQVEFRQDHTEPPYRKSHIRPIAIEVELQNENDSDEDDTEGDEELATQVRGSYFYKQSQVSVKYLRKLMGGKAFPNPKDHTEIAKIIDYVTSGTTESEEEIILDFFGGSGATAQAVIDLNSEEDKKRQFILVQLPEIIDEKDPAFKFGYRRISDITIDRVKRIVESYQKETSELLPGEPQRQFADSLGFKVYKLAKSRFPRVEFAPDPEKSEVENVEALKCYILEKESSFHIQLDKEPVRDELLLKQGFMFDYTLTPQPEFTKNEVVLARDAHKESLLCLDTVIAPETVDYFQTHKDRFFICLELALDTTKKWNLKHHIADKLKTV
jgi:adenine-specific DNA-methyltransferase